MKFLHTSDWHLGMTFSGGISFEADQRYALDSILEIISGEKVDGVLIPGDIFDKSIVSQEALRLYDEYITRICLDLNVPVFLTAGNHDSPERLSGCRRLLEKSGLYICGILEKEPCVINRGDTDIFLLPWISTDKVKSLYPDDAEKIVSMEDAYRIVLDGFRKRFVKGHKNILLAHAFVSGAETSVSDRAAEVGRAAMIVSSVFDGFDYVALGHIHGAQKAGKDSIRYCGTPLKYSFSEANDEKSVLVVELENKGTVHTRTVSLKPLHDMREIKGTYEELTLKKNYEGQNTQDYVHITLTDEEDVIDAVAKLRVIYPNLMKLDYDNTRTRSGTQIIENLSEVQTSSPIDLFMEFFKTCNGKDMSDEQKEYVQNKIDKIWSEV